MIFLGACLVCLSFFGLAYCAIAMRVVRNARRLSLEQIQAQAPGALVTPMVVR